MWHFTCYAITTSKTTLHMRLHTNAAYFKINLLTKHNNTFVVMSVIEDFIFNCQVASVKTLHTLNVGSLVVFFSCCLMYDLIQFSVAFTTSTVNYSFHLFFFLSSNICCDCWTWGLYKSSLFLNWDITLLHMQSSVTGWRLRSRVKGRNRTQCLLLSSPPPFAYDSSPFSLLSFRHFLTFILLIPLVRLATKKHLFLLLPLFFFIFLSSSPLCFFPLCHPGIQTSLNCWGGICWSSRCSCWSNKDPSEW